MNIYYLYIGLPSAKFNEEVKGTYFEVRDNRINFIGKNQKVVASYPSQYTIIEKIKYHGDK